MTATSASLLGRLHENRDPTAWQRLVDLYSPLIRSWLRRHAVQDRDADDLIQEVLAVVAVLLACGCYWSVRGRRLLKPRRLFISC